MKTRATLVTGSFFLLLIILLVTSGCSSRNGSRVAGTSSVAKTASAVRLSDSSAVRDALLEQYGEWHGTPYRMGGLDKRGIDCSGFAYITFRSKLGYSIPRTTKSQAQSGRYISLQDLRAGDLIFFKTSIRYNHVGIYLGDKQFLHASSSKGVMISGLNERYWKKHYWTARRISN